MKTIEKNGNLTGASSEVKSQSPRQNESLPQDIEQHALVYCPNTPEAKQCRKES